REDRSVRAKWQELIGGGHQIAADRAGDADDDHPFIEPQLEPGADTCEVAVSAHENEGVDGGSVENRLDHIHQHVEVNGALGDDLLLWRIVGAAIAIAIAVTVAVAGIEALGLVVTL